MAAVREPTTGDADALGAVHVAAWQRAYRGGLMPDEYLDSLDVEERAQRWREGLQTAPRPRFCRFLVEDDRGAVVGFITAGPADGEPTSDTGEVFALNVDPESWGRGYGAALLESGVQALAAAGFDTAVLWVHPENRRARLFYEQRGWGDDGSSREQDVLGVIVPEVRYRARLTDRQSEDR